MPRVGFVGLGLMGGSLALNLLRAGLPVSVFNRPPARAAPHAAGAQILPLERLLGIEVRATAD